MAETPITWALLEALQHLFNLRFHTEEETKTVRIEPADEFFGSGTTADWRDRSDFSQPVVLADIAPEIHESRTWGYQEGDGAVNRFNAGAGSPFGEWSVRTDSYAAREGDQVLRNPLFRPTLSEAGHYANAPSAQIMQVGDRDDVQEDGTNFTPRIVRFAGLHPLPAGERWGYPSGLAEYPLAAFHFPGDAATEGFTLCFEDRDGIRGLVENRYMSMDGSALSGILTIGGTILGTSRDKVHRMIVDGEVRDMRTQVVENYEKEGLDGLVLLGGGGNSRLWRRIREGEGLSYGV